ncbi:hypothetical protein WUBG_15088 [Wuchereria bancrofti]|uniref:Uncharacterized protein n=1 Tax=Wuchereria bancrofti TaxID=6293 RepID=J9EF01_WUCBA|nr:hypothetical protein WUBG_15088 [Wuchereria bancrofti]
MGTKLHEENTKNCDYVTNVTFCGQVKVTNVEDMSLGSEPCWVVNYRLRYYAVNSSLTTAISKERYRDKKVLSRGHTSVRETGGNAVAVFVNVRRIYLVEKRERIKNNVLLAQSMRLPCVVYFEIEFAYLSFVF